MNSASFEERVARVSGEIESARMSAAERENRDRSKIAKWVVWLYMAIVGACFIFVIGANWFLDICAGNKQTGCVNWEGPADFLLKVLTTAVLPIVTLVLGYYFGTATTENDENPD